MAEEKLFNNQFLTNILQKYENDETLKVEDFKLVLACQPGENFTCDVKRIHIEGRRKVEGPYVVYRSTIILKQIPANEKHAEIYRSKVALENEINAYTKIIPVLEKYSADGSLPVPKCLQTGDGYILLEDLFLEGYHTVDRNDGGLTLEQCTTVISVLAKLHAASIVLEQKEPQTLQALSKLTIETMFVGGEQLLNSQKRYIQHALDVFKKMEQSPEQQKALEFLNYLQANVDKISRRLLEEPKEHSVIGHGDAWVCNMMFNANQVKLIDLQLMRYNSVAVDLCHLFYVNLKPSMWAEHMESLQEKYLEALHQNIKAKGVNLDNVLTMEWLRQEMSRFEEYAIIRSLWIMPLFFYKSEDVSLENVSEDLLTNIDHMNSKVGEEYAPRMKELILNFIKNRNGK